MMVATAGLGWPPQAYLNGLRVNGGFVPARPANGVQANGVRANGVRANGPALSGAGLGWPADVVDGSAASASASGAPPPPPPARLREVLSGVSRETVVGGQPPAAESTSQQSHGQQSDGNSEQEPGESEDEVAIPGGSADTPIARAAQAAVVARSGGQQWPRPRSCRIMTVANQKGGVGKTTTAVNLAASLAMHGSRVLVVDLDPQGNASTALDVDHHSGIGSVYNVLVEGQPLAAVISRVAGFKQLYCAPATIDLAGAEIELVPLVARESRLARAVGQFNASDLDYILIDCPPSLGLLTVNALVAAPEVLIPIQCEY